LARSCVGAHHLNSQRHKFATSADNLKRIIGLYGWAARDLGLRGIDIMPACG
jgi:hypothetical protein